MPEIQKVGWGPSYECNTKTTSKRGDQSADHALLKGSPQVTATATTAEGMYFFMDRAKGQKLALNTFKYLILISYCSF
jgi:hypothetical protein